MTDKHKAGYEMPENKFLSNAKKAAMLISVLIIALTVQWGFTTWRTNPYNELVIETFDGRAIDSMSFIDHSQAQPVEDELSEQRMNRVLVDLYFYKEYEPIIENGEVLHPEYDVWLLSEAYRQLSGDIGDDPYEFIIKFENGEETSIYFTENELEIDGTYYSTGTGPNPIYLLYKNVVEK